MRKNFKELVENVFQGNSEARIKLNEILSDSSCIHSSLKKDEINLLEEKSNLLLPHVIAYCLKGQLSYLKKDYQQAAYYFEEAINKGDTDAMIHRAHMHKHGYGSSVNYEAAIHLYDNAIALGNTQAMVSKADMYSSLNYEEAFRLYDNAIALGNTQAMTIRAFLHQKGYHGPVNYRAAIHLYDNAIALGNTQAMLNRADMHYYGQGGPVNYAEAVKLYRQVACMNAPYGPPHIKILLLNLTDRIRIHEEHPDFALVQYQILIIKNTPSFTFLKSFPHLLSYFIDDPLISITDKIATLAALQYHKELTCFLINYISSILEAFPSSPFILPEELPSSLFVEPLRETLLNALIALNTPNACLIAGLLIQTHLEQLLKKDCEKPEEEFDKTNLYYAVALYETVINMTNENEKLYQYAQLYLGHLKIIFNLNLSTNPSPVNFVSSDAYFKPITNDFSEKASWEPFEKKLKQTLKTHLKQWNNSLSLHEFYLKYLITQEESPLLFIEGLIQALFKKDKTLSYKENELYTLLDKTVQNLTSAVSKKIYTPSFWTFNNTGALEKLAFLNERLANLKQSTGKELQRIFNIN